MREDAMSRYEKPDRGHTPIGIGILGMGVVGTGVARVLFEKGEELAARIGRPISVRRILVKDPTKPRPTDVPSELLTTDPGEVLSDPDVHIVVELIGGRGAARDYLLGAIDLGKHVVTANKELVAWQGPELLSLAAGKDVHVRFEASVAAGTPVLAPITRDLAANDILSIRGIVNGTTNYILTQMATNGLEFRTALKNAQELGYAESDPTNDIEGIDAAYKLAILCNLAWGVHMDPSTVYREGIANIEARDLTYSWRTGHTIKLMAIARKFGDVLEARVHPALVPDTVPIAQIGGALNAIEVETDLAGQIVFQGPGAGASPTASAVVADLIEIGRAISLGTCSIIPPRPVNRLTVRPIDDLETRYYLRLSVTDPAGVLEPIEEILAKFGVGVHSVIHRDTGALGERAELVLMTDRAGEASLQLALKSLEELPVVHGVMMLRVEDK
jgi:homoserine dehydrogenase